MPGFDQTGPQGQGPLTGGGRGRCGPGDAPAQGAVWGVGRGGRPRGGGRGRCFGGGRGQGWNMRNQAAPITEDPAALRDEIKSLSEEVAALRAELDEARNRAHDTE